MMFNATLNNISVILWRSVLLVVKTGENHRQKEQQIKLNTRTFEGTVN